MFKAVTKVRETYCIKVKSDSFQQEVKAKCLGTKYALANEVLARIEDSRDLVASNSVYTTNVVALSLDWENTQMKIVMNHLPIREKL